ncbi:MAG: histidine phosphatase superfamily, partial [Olpidium bornovanus]
FLAYLDYLVPRRCHLLPLPCNRRLTSCLTEKDVDAILDNAHWEFEHLFRDGDHAEAFTRATTGPFLAELRDSVFRHAKAASERGRAKPPRYNDGSEDLRNSAFELYSTHEETIAALLGAFKAKYVHVPPYSSNIVVELWRDPAGAGEPGGYDEFFIRILYNGEIVEVPWCDLNACPVEWVWQYTKPLIPDDVEAECGTKYFKGDSGDGDFDEFDDFDDGAIDPDVDADPAAGFAA